MANNNNKSANPSSPGSLLAAERKKRKLQERETADALKISVSRLRSIEADDFSIFPSETYIRGHLRNYCRFLKLDEQHILSLYSENQPMDTLDEATSGDDSLSVDNGQKRWWFVYLVLVAFVLLWALSYWLLGAQKKVAVSEEQVLPDVLLSERREDVLSPSESLDERLSAGIAATQDIPIADSEPAQVAVDKPLEGNANENESASASQDLPAVVDAFSPTDSPAGNTAENDKGIIVSKLTAAELVETIRSQEEPVQPLEAQVPVGDTLEFVFENASWIQVIDSTGAVLFKGLNKPGAELDLNGKAPFNIVIGNVDGTSLVYNGENVELAAPRGKNALRLNLGG